MIGSFPVFADLPAAAERRLGGLCSWRRYGAGRQVVGHQDTSADLFLIAEGAVRVQRFSAAGREVSYTDIGAGELFGEFSAIDGQPRSATVVTLAASRIGRMPRAVFRDCLLEHPAVALKLLESVVAKVRLLSDRVYEAAALQVRERLHVELLRLAHGGAVEDNRAVVAPAPTHREIAARIGTHREAVTRELRQLAQDGLVALKRGRIEVTDLAGLERLAAAARGE